MRTPKEFIKNVKNKIITSEMLDECLYSLNTRSRHCGFKKLNYIENFGGRWGKYSQQYEEREIEYFILKDLLLTSLLKPICIQKYNRMGQFILNKPMYLEYYRSFGFKYFGYNRPIDEKEAIRLNKEQNIQIIETDDCFETVSTNIDNIISMQFVYSVIDLMTSKNYKYIDNSKSFTQMVFEMENINEIGIKENYIVYLLKRFGMPVIIDDTKIHDFIIQKNETNPYDFFNSPVDKKINKNEPILYPDQYYLSKYAISELYNYVNNNYQEDKTIIEI